MPTLNKLEYLDETKQQIKNALNTNFNSQISDDDTFRSYVSKINVIYDNWPKVAGEDTSITLNNTKKGKMLLATAPSELTQETTPTPDNPSEVQVIKGNNSIKIENKNLAWTGWAEDFVSRINSSSVASKETYDNRNCLKYNANAGAGDYDNKYLFKTNWKENTQYTIICDIYSGSTSGNICFEYTDGTTKRPSNITTSSWNSIKLTSDTSKTIKYIRVYNGASYTYIDLDTFMVYEGTENIDYVAHQEQVLPLNLPNGMEYCKIGNYSDEFIKTSGKNLFDETQLLNATDWALNDNGYYYGTLSNYHSAFQNGFSFNSPFKENTQYTLTVKAYTTGGTPVIKFQYTDGTSANLTLSGTSATDYSYTTIEGKTLSKIMGTYGSGGSNTLYIKNIQLEESTIATDYEPYGTNKWYLNKKTGKTTLNGTQSISTINAGLTGFIRVYYSFLDSIIKTDSVMKSNYFEYKNDTSLSNHIKGGVGGSNFSIFITKDIATNGTEFNTWLSTHNTDIYYQLLAPTHTEITDTTLISQLNAIEQAVSYDEQTNISQTNAELPFIISASALIKGGN